TIPPQYIELNEAETTRVGCRWNGHRRAQDREGVRAVGVLSELNEFAESALQLVSRPACQAVVEAGVALVPQSARSNGLQHDAIRIGNEEAHNAPLRLWKHFQ